MVKEGDRAIYHTIKEHTCFSIIQSMHYTYIFICMRMYAMMRLYIPKLLVNSFVNVCILGEQGRIIRGHDGA